MRDKSAISAANLHMPARSVDKAPSRRANSVAVLVYEGVGLFELGVAIEVFGSNDLGDLGARWYRLFVCGASPGLVTVEGGLQLQVKYGLDQIRRAGTVVVPPTDHLEQVPREIFEALRRAHARGCRIVSLCTGAFVLAEAGLLEGRRATTHWSDCNELARRYSGVSVDPAVLYIDDGDILTSAGSAASIDLCLHIVRRDYGSDVATRLARQLVVSPQRDGGQAQFIEAPIPALEGEDLFSGTVAWAQEHLDEPLTVADMASRSAMSPRTFARRFLAATGTTPHQWVQRRRVYLVQRLLEVSDLSIEAVAERSGFRTAGNLRKHFTRALKTTPQAYRRTFQERNDAKI